MNGLPNGWYFGPVEREGWRWLYRPDHLAVNRWADLDARAFAAAMSAPEPRMRVPEADLREDGAGAMSDDEARSNEQAERISPPTASGPVTDAEDLVSGRLARGAVGMWEAALMEERRLHQETRDQLNEFGRQLAEIDDAAATTPPAQPDVVQMLVARMAAFTEGFTVDQFYEHMKAEAARLHPATEI